MNPAPGSAGFPNWGAAHRSVDPHRYEPLRNAVWPGQPGIINANNDGLLGGGEQPVSGVIVVLRDVTGAIIATDTTDLNGYYFFDGLLAGVVRRPFAGELPAQWDAPALLEQRPNNSQCDGGGQ